MITCQKSAPSEPVIWLNYCSNGKIFLSFFNKVQKYPLKYLKKHSIMCSSLVQQTETLAFAKIEML